MNPGPKLCPELNNLIIWFAGDENMIDTVIFDFDGTLVDFICSDVSALRMLAQYLDREIDENLFIETAVDEIKNFHSIADQNLADPLQMHEYRLKKTLERFGVVYSEEHLKVYKDSMVNNCKPYKGVVSLLKKISVNYKIGLLTNAYDAGEQSARIANSGLEKYFNEIVISGEIGIYKPDPEIFKYILKKMESLPENTVFVGDSVAHDIKGAKNIGMKTVLVTESIPDMEIPSADYIVGRKILNAEIFVNEILI